MGLFKKKSDPIDDRSRHLTAKISALESKIKKLNEELQPGNTPRLRSTAYPGGAPDPPSAGAATPRPSEPVFEKVDQGQLKAPAEPVEPARHLHELDAPRTGFQGLWEWVKKEFQGPPAANPKLVSYLAAGSIQGLRPLRYEKRVARNRCLALAVLFLLACLGIFYALEHRH